MVWRPGPGQDLVRSFTRKKSFAGERELNIPEANVFTQCFVPHEKKHSSGEREKTFAHFRTVSGLQNLVHHSDAKPQIKFACPKHQPPSRTKILDPLRGECCTASPQLLSPEKLCLPINVWEMRPTVGSEMNRPESTGSKSAKLTNFEGNYTG